MLEQSVREILAVRAVGNAWQRWRIGIVVLIVSNSPEVLGYHVCRDALHRLHLTPGLRSSESASHYTEVLPGVGANLAARAHGPPNGVGCAPESQPASRQIARDKAQRILRDARNR